MKKKKKREVFFFIFFPNFLMTQNYEGEGETETHQKKITVPVKF
jgi:hypothetical protein